MCYIPSESYIRALPDGDNHNLLSYLCSVQNSRPPANQKTKTGVEPTILPIATLFILALFQCVYSKGKIIFQYKVINLVNAWHSQKIINKLQ